MNQRTCNNCDTAFEPVNANQDYCSVPCRSQRIWRDSPRVACSICGLPTGYKPTQATTAAHRECRAQQWEHGTTRGYRVGKCKCDECKAAMSRAQIEHRARNDAGLTQAPPCEEPGCERLSAARRLCRMHYKRWARANNPTPCPSDAWSDNRRSNGHTRRARLAGARNGDKVLLATVIERDGTDCAWCGQQVDLELKWPDRLSKSLDHAQPLSRGGTHSLDNAQLMHLSCNASKGARVATSGPSNTPTRSRASV
jgi:hypothetical protein